MSKPLVICLMGPTAVGKTDLAIELYYQLNSELPIDIISVDSAMVYTGLNIGTGKPTAELLNKVTHKLVDIREPNDIYSVADFCFDALNCIKQAHENNRIPLLVGGTMMYFRSLQFGLAKLPSSDEAIRIKLINKLQQEGLTSLYNELLNIDAVAAGRINCNDTQRIIRALEVYYISGCNITELLAQDDTYLYRSLTHEYNVLNLVIAPSLRSFLHDNIAKRFHQMLAMGFITEVDQLRTIKNFSLSLPALRSCGYRQVLQYLLGNFTEQEMIEKSIIATRQLAKRQLTWLRSWDDAIWYDTLQSTYKAAVVDKIIKSCNYL